MTPTQYSKIQDKLVRLLEIKQKRAALDEEYSTLENEVIALMDKIGEKTATVSDESGALTGTVVRGSTLQINEDGLRKALGAKLWAKVTKRVIDKKKLEAFTVTGEISPMVVAAHSEEKQSKPYVRLSNKQNPKEQ